MNNKVIVAAIAVIVVFLLGFVPQYVKVNRLESELRTARQEGAGAQLRDLIGLAYVQANQKNFGLAAESSSRFFGRVREAANQTQDAASRKSLEDLLALRDKVTAELAKGDAAAMGDLQDLFVKTRQATATSEHFRSAVAAHPSPRPCGHGDGHTPVEARSCPRRLRDQIDF